VPEIPGIRVETPQTLAVSFQARLLKFDPPFALPVTGQNRRELERRLFAWSYKGVTDLVTKWAWPLPARWAVGQCVRLGIRPNQVTAVSLALVVLAGLLFARGHFGWGLLAGWIMTFLDTVDGKLARVTVTSSRFGHYFDHLIDLVHPPAWYILWGIGLSVFRPAPIWFDTGAVLWYIVAGYIAGRLAEGLFQWRLGRFGIFCWRPADSYFRLVTARRNPNLLLLTLSVLAGRPDLGLLAVAFWTVLTSGILLLRLAAGAVERRQRGALRSWLADAGSDAWAGTLAARLFTRRSAA
jgi:phosphatidylglycerophosphate synthase